MYACHSFQDSPAIVAGVANRLDLSEREAYIAVQSLGHSGGVDALIRLCSCRRLELRWPPRRRPW
jgi:hypothetical protein